MTLLQCSSAPHDTNACVDQAAIKFQMDEMAAARALVETCPPDDPDTMVNQACIMYAEQRYEAALGKFTEAMALVTFREDLAYNIALCNYRCVGFHSCTHTHVALLRRALVTLRS